MSLSALWHWKERGNGGSVMCPKHSFIIVATTEDYTRGCVWCFTVIHFSCSDCTYWLLKRKDILYTLGVPGVPECIQIYCICEWYLGSNSWTRACKSFFFNYRAFSGSLSQRSFLSFLLFKFSFCLGGGGEAHLAVLSFLLSPCSGVIPVGLREPSAVPRIQPRSAICKANDISLILITLTSEPNLFIAKLYCCPRV